MVPLQLNASMTEGAAGAKLGLQLRQECGKVRRARVQTDDNRHHLAATAALATDPRRLVLRQKHLSIDPPRTTAYWSRLRAILAGDWALQRSSIKQAGHVAMIAVAKSTCDADPSQRRSSVSMPTQHHSCHPLHASGGSGRPGSLDVIANSGRAGAAATQCAAADWRHARGCVNAGVCDQPRWVPRW